MRRGVVALVALLLSASLLGHPVAADVVVPVVAAGEVPVVEALWPNAGAAPGGETIAIHGRGFRGATGVRFGLATPAASFTVVSDDQIDAVAPPARVAPNPLTLVNVFVDTPAGTSVETPASWYRYLVPPTITSITPTTSSFQGGQSITLVVAGLPPSMYPTAVTVGDVAVTNLSYGAHDVGGSLRVDLTAPPHAAGAAAVTVTAAGGTSGPVTLTYLAVPRPVVTDVSPDHAVVTGGTTVTITGEGFTGATAVDFGPGAPAASFTVDADTQITAVTPAVPTFGVVSVRVTTPAGPNASTGLPFFFDGPPVVWSIAPANGSPAGGTVVDILGDDVARATGVWFGEVPATSWHPFGDRIVAVAPPHAAGTVTVRLDSALGRSREAVDFTYTTTGPPTVDALAPKHGPMAGGNRVVVTGSGFTGATAVDFAQGTAPASFTVDSDTQITAIAPASAYDGLFNVSVTNGHGTSPNVSSAWYTYDLAPWVTNVSPPLGPTTGGTPVVISGAGFADATAVRFGGVAAPSFSYDPWGNIVAVSPPHAAGPATVTVETPSGTSDATAWPSDTFLFYAPGLPVISSMDAVSGWTSGGRVVTITGTDLDTVTGVRFGDVPATDWSIVDATTLRVTSPPGAVGPVPVVLRSTAGEGPVTYRSTFTYQVQPAPTVYSFEPAAGPLHGGNTVVLHGFALTGATGVTFNGTPAPSFTVDSDWQLTVVVPPSGASDDTPATVLVTTPFGTSPPPNTPYLYQAVHELAITSVLPNRGGIAGGEWPSIYGRGFLATTAVTVGGKPAHYVVNSDYQITIETPPMDVPFLYNVEVRTATATTPSTPASHYLYLGTPELWGLDHHLGLTSGGDQVTITGDQLLDVTAVDVGAVSVSFRVVDNHTITATFPRCAAGTFVVVLRSGRGDSAPTFGALFTARDPGTPIVTQVERNRGSVAGGETVVIHGQGFTGITGVRFDAATAARSFTVDSDTQITAIAPSRATAALVNVFVDGADGSNPNGPASWYLYQAP